MHVEEPCSLEGWTIQVNENLDHMRNTDLAKSEMEEWKRRSIYKVLECLTDLNQKAYKPRAVSFGPYHHGQPHLLPMEEHKDRALLHFLKRCSKPVDPFISALRAVASDLMASYYPLDHDRWNEDNFVKMMLRDGCFMLEILRTAAETVNDYAPNDPIFSVQGKLYIMSYIKRDMLMLENQLPMIALNELRSVETTGKRFVEAEKDGKRDKEFINRLIVKFCSPRTHITEMRNSLHVLDVFRKSLLQGVEPPSNQPKLHTSRKDCESEEQIIRSATELDQAGIEFKRTLTRGLKGIQFRDGVLKLPVIVVDHSTEYMFLNLIAYEHFHVGVGTYITSYIFFMNSIINSKRDVALLHSKGIIQNAIGSDKAVAELFNSLSKNVTLDPENVLDEVHKEVSEYCKKPRNKWRAKLSQFNSQICGQFCLSSQSCSSSRSL